MRLLFSILASGALALSACAPLEEPSFGECRDVLPEIIAYAKDGTPIYSEVLGLTIFAPTDGTDDNGGVNGGGNDDDGDDCVTPPCDPGDPGDPDDPTDPGVTTADKKCNCGSGNGPEGDPDCDPGNSGDNNQAGD